MDAHATIHDTRRAGYVAEKEELLARLRRIEGQIRGLMRMIEEERYCPDVLTQLAAVRSALGQVGLLLLRSHTEHCVARALQRGDDRGPIEDLVAALDRFLR